MTDTNSTDGINVFIRTYNYSACLAPGKIWTLVEAVDYISAHLAGKENWFTRDEAYQGLVNIRGRLLRAMKHDIDGGRLIVNEVYIDDVAAKNYYEIDIERSTVQPYIFISWAIAYDISVPKEFARYLEDKKISKLDRYEGLGIKRSTIHHERCRAVAELLWEIEPELPIAQMARRREIIQYGCEGLDYDMRTISRWLASLKEVRQLGRPKSKESDNQVSNG